MLAPISSPGPHGLSFAGEAEGVVLPVGPVVALLFTLPIAGPVPADFEEDPPQSCQNSSANVALQAQLVDQSGDAIDLSAATALQFWLKAPDGSVRPVPAEWVSNGQDGRIQYVTTGEDLPQAGLWQLQAQATFNAQQLLTRWASFRADSNIPDA